MTAGTAGTPLRGALLIAAGALGLHELRYVLVYHGDAAEMLALQGHHYLALITPLAAGLLVLALQPFLALAGGGRPAPRGAGPGLVRLWALASGALLAVYVAQEWLEGELARAHPGGVEGIVGHGGWTAVLLAAAIGGLVALALRGAREAVAVAVRGVGVPVLRRRALVVATPALPPRAPRDVVACFLAGRGPPASA